MTAAAQPEPVERPATSPAPRRPAAGAVQPQPGRLARLNTGSLLYGTIVSTAALVLGANQGETAADIINVMVATLVVYWLAHVYIESVGSYAVGALVPLRRRVPAAARQEATILVGGLPTLAVVVAESIAGISVWAISLSALAAAIGMLVVDGVLVGLRAGMTGWRLAAEAVSAAVFGIVIAILMVYLHAH